MPLFDGPAEAVDRVYAQSLFELADSAGGRERLEELSGEVDELGDFLRGQRELSEFMSSQIIPPDARDKSLRAIFEGKVSDLLLRFMLTLNRKGRLNRFLRIGEAFEEMVQEKFGRVEIDVYTRHALPPDQLESIKARLQTALQREPVLHAYTDPAMIGGVKMQVGDRLIDASIATRLRKMRDLMAGDGAALMRARFDRAVED
jgi:F-type H+-transporting ATPase subunit delta